MSEANDERARGVVETAIRAALEAGALALDGFRRSDLEVDVKSDIHDLVTPYDRAAEAHIRRVILERFPDASVVGEEEGASAGAGRLTWYVDPIDGTSNFARGIAMWAVSIGVAIDGEMAVGVIHDPSAGQLFWADDRGAFLAEGPVMGRGRGGGGRGERVAGAGSALRSVADVLARSRPLRSRGYTTPAQATVALNFPLARDLVHHPELALEQFAEVTRRFGQVRGLGSTCVALAWIAAGWLDVTISFETNPWDVAAGALIIRRAGGIYRSYAAGELLPERGDHLGPHYYAAVPGGDFELLHEIMRTQSRRP